MITKTKTTFCCGCGILLLVFLLSVAPVTPKGALAEAPSKKLKVGVILPLSGPMKSFGDAMQTGISMALANHPDSALEVIYEDYRYETTAALSAYKRLVESTQVDVLAMLGTPATLAIVPLAETRGIPLFTWSASPVASQNRPSVVRMIPSGAVQGQALADEASRKGYRAIAFVGAAHEYSAAVRDGVLSSAAKETVLLHEEFPPDVQDFRTFLAKARRLNVDALGVCLTSAQIPAFARQVRAQGLTAPIFGCHMMGSEDVLRSGGAALDNAWFIEAKLGDDFYKEYLNRSDEAGPAWTAAGFFDLAEQLQSLAQSGVDPKQITSAVVGQCVRDGGYPSSCIVERNGEKVVEMELGVTHIRGGKFVRETVPAGSQK